MQRLFTSESVCIGHPDRVADQISDAILDEILVQDPLGRVACEALVKNNSVIIAGEITANADIDISKIARQTIKEVGYTTESGFDLDNCNVSILLTQQSHDIADAVKTDSELCAGDQGIMFGFASNETSNFMPMPIDLARRICTKATQARQSGQISWLRPDGKAQVTIEYDGFKPVRIHTVVCSLQHNPDVPHDQIVKDIREQIIDQVLPAHLVDKNTTYLINPSGRFIIGGPQGDCGLTGRKIICDTYGGMARHGGGAFSGKDPTKVDRTAAYVARHCAKNVVAAGLADRCEIQLSYAIGVSKPISVFVETFGTEKIALEKITNLINNCFDFTPSSMIRSYNLQRPIYKATARNGHVGVDRPECTWEKLDKVDFLKA
jgi:S-adenosylmethionine synthetase